MYLLAVPLDMHLKEPLVSLQGFFSLDKDIFIVHGKLSWSSVIIQIGSYNCLSHIVKPVFSSALCAITRAYHIQLLGVLPHAYLDMLSDL